VCTTFFCISKTTIGLPKNVSYAIGFAGLLVAIVWFFSWLHKYKKSVKIG
jgi:hypothetical protein